MYSDIASEGEEACSGLAGVLEIIALAILVPREEFEQRVSPKQSPSPRTFERSTPSDR